MMPQIRPKSLGMRFLQEETGATMIEYGLMVAAIAVTCMATVGLLGVAADTLFSRNDNAVRNALAGP